MQSKPGASIAVVGDRDACGDGDVGGYGDGDDEDSDDGDGDTGDGDGDDDDSDTYDDAGGDTDSCNADGDSVGDWWCGDGGVGDGDVGDGDDGDAYGNVDDGDDDEGSPALEAAKAGSLGWPLTAPSSQDLGMHCIILKLLFVQSYISIASFHCIISKFPSYISSRGHI